MITLYYTAHTCSLASHIALEDAGAEYDLRRIDFASTEQQSPEFLKINPKARVPAMMTPRGILTETPAMLAFIAQSYPDAGLAPLDDPFAFAEIQSFNSYLCLNKENESNTTRTPFSNLVDPSDPEKLAEVQKYQAEARKRLGKPDQADIYLTHKITKYGDLGTGDIAAEYSKNSTTVLAGHKHAIQIGDIEGEQQLDEILMRSNLEEEIDGYKIKVIEMDGNEPLQLNAGSNFALEVVYNSNKEWEEVVIYQLQER